MAPECWSGRCYDGRGADLWSLGILLYGLCCGAFPEFHTNETGEKLGIVECKGMQGFSPELMGLLETLVAPEEQRKAISLDMILHHPWLERVQVLEKARLPEPPASPGSQDSGYTAGSCAGYNPPL